MLGAAADEYQTRIMLARVSALVEKVPADPPSWLGAQERIRFGLLSSAHQRRQFLAGRALARQAYAIAAAPGSAFPGLTAPEQGPPGWLTGPEGEGVPLKLSLSHSGDWVACALSCVRVGVDVQVSTRSRDVLALADLVCTPDERQWLTAREGQARQDGFHALWALKESGFKAWGLARMDQMGFTPQPMVSFASAWTLLLEGAVVAVVVDAPCRLVVESEIPTVALPVPWYITTPEPVELPELHAGPSADAYVSMLWPSAFMVR